MTPFRPDDYIDDYFAGELSEERAAKVRAYLEASPGRRGVMAGIRAAALGKNFASSPSPELIRVRHDALMARISTTEAEPVRAAARGVRRRVVPFVRGTNGVRGMVWRSGIAAALGGAVLILTVWMRSPSPEGTSNVQSHVYVTRPGERAVVHLDDGSEARLGPATRLTVATEKGGIRATVDGVASFTVRHDVWTPFSVRAGRASVVVLGTTFVVRHYADESVTRVVVADGRVALRDAIHQRAATAVLGARQLGVVDDSGHVRIVPNVSLDESTVWIRGELVFRETPVSEILSELRRAYAVDVRVSDSVLARHTLTFTVPVGSRPLTDVLDAMAASLDAHVTKAGRILTLVPGGSSMIPRRSLPRSTLTTETQYGK